MSEGNRRDPWVPFAVYESAMARNTQDKKRWNMALVASTLIATVVVAASLIINNTIWQRHEMKILGD
jgi:hypothetical protein